MLVSALLILVAVALLRRLGHSRWLAWFLLAAILMLTVLSGLQIGLGQITGEGVNGAVFYHLRTGLEGGDVSQYGWGIAAGLVALAVVAGGLWRARRWIRPGSATPARRWDTGIALLVFAALAIHPVLIASAAYALRFSLVAQQVEGFHDPMRDPAGPENPRNLVILYLESLERTYMDEQRFPGLTPNLAQLEERAVTFTDLGQTDGATFTIGGMVATQCGVPLILTGGPNSMRVSQFLSGATCMGDILSEAGYTLSYLGGGSTEFAGKGAFYESHSYDEVTGLEQLRPLLADPEYMAEWGLQDDTLFELGHERFNRLSSGDQPFVLTMLTLDTHHPNGHADTNRVCGDIKYQDGSNPMLNAVMCGDYLAGQFINEILSGPHAQDTVIAIMSDHLAMVNTAADQLNAGPRRNLLMILDADTQPAVIDRPATTLDTGPTLMSFLGFDMPLMGLGADLLGDEPTIPEALGIDVQNTRALADHIMGYQSVYTRLWAYPDITDGLYVNLEGNKAQFGHSTFRLPVILEFDEANAISQAILGDRSAQETLIEVLIDLPDGTKYIWIDECRALSLMEPGEDLSSLSALCALTGERNRGVGLRALSQSDYLDETQLAAMLTIEPSEGGDTEALTRIGQARGDIPMTMGLPALTTGDKGVLLQSSAFGAGASVVRRETMNHLRSGEDWSIRRGINLVGISADGRAEVLDQLDQCAGGFDGSTHTLWTDQMSQSSDRFVAHAIIVHDTAYCGSSFDTVAAPLEGLDVPELRASAMREAYVAVIPVGGQVLEFPNRAFPRYRLFLDPMAGNTVPAQIEAAAADAAPIEIVAEEPITEASAAVAPIAEASVVETTAAETVETKPAPAAPAEVTACQAPTNTTVSQPAGVIRVGGRYAGVDLQTAIGFASGWWGQEQSGRWSGARTVSVSVILPEGDTGLALDFEMASPVIQVIALTYAGTEIARGVIDGADTFRAEVGSLPRGVPVRLDLVIEGPELSCPAVRGSSSDARQMGFMLKSVTLSQTDAAVVPLQVATPGAAVTVASTATPSDGVCKIAGIRPAVRTAQAVLPLNQQISVAEAINAGSFGVSEGWWSPEPFGVWMGANQAKLQVILPETTGPLTLSIMMAAFGSDSVGAVLSLNGTELARHNAGLQTPMVADVTDLPRDVVLDIMLSIPGVALDCPALADGGSDTRALGLMIQSLQLTQGKSAPFTGSIAHAGGRLGGTALSDSFDALNANIDSFDVFEIDFNWTTDGELVCLHDWEGAFTSRFGTDVAAPVDQDTFTRLLAASPDKPRNCDLNGLAGWLRANPGVRIVTDVKENPVAAHEMIVARYPDLLAQFVPQAYQPQEVTLYRSMGFDRVIWTLYQFGDDPEKVIREALAANPNAITMPQAMADAGLLQAVIEATDFPVYVHTINDPQTASCLLARGASGIYSDDLAQAEVKDIRAAAANCS